MCLPQTSRRLTVFEYLLPLGANSGDQNPGTPTEQRVGPIEVELSANEPTSIGGRDCSGLALDRAHGRGVSVLAFNGNRVPSNSPDAHLPVKTRP